MTELVKEAKRYLCEHGDDYGKSLVSALLDQLERKDKEIKHHARVVDAHITRRKELVGCIAELRESNKVLVEALTISRGQWIHSVNAEQCLKALANEQEIKESIE